MLPRHDFEPDFHFGVTRCVKCGYQRNAEIHYPGEAAKAAVEQGDAHGPIGINFDKPQELPILPTTAKERKDFPLAAGLFDYFPAALVAVSYVSHVGNQQHNPGEPIHWARGKSMDQDDTMLRHFVERGTIDSDGIRHSAKMAWRALAILQLELEAAGYPKARGAK